MMLPLLWSFFSQGTSSEELDTSAKILLHKALMLLRDLSHSLTSAICSSIMSFYVHLFLIGFLVSRCVIFFTSGNCNLHSYQLEEQKILLHKSDSDEDVGKKELLHLSWAVVFEAQCSGTYIISGLGSIIIARVVIPNHR